MRLRVKAGLAIAAIVLLVWALRQAGPALVIDRPQRSDAMLVLAGDTDDLRYWHGVDLLRAGYASQLFLDARSDNISYGRTATQMAEDFLTRSPADLRGRVHVCPTIGNSTVMELKSAAACVGHSGAHSVLIVTSDFHTRRALSVAQKLFPGYRWSVAATDNGLLSIPRWWSSRVVVKQVFLEWQKLAWWELVERHQAGN